MDMSSISVQDLQGAKAKKLEGHLKSGDFFEVGQYPTSTFTITGVKAMPGDTSVSHLISGNLSMKDSVKNIELPAFVELSDDRLMANTPKFTIDRTKWGVKFRSGVIGTVKDRIINDQLGLQINLQAAKPEYEALEQ